MTPDPAITEGLAVVAQSVVTALGNVQSAAGPIVAQQACLVMITLATQHLLSANGPQAAREALASVWRDLQAEIAAQNGGSGVLS
jgi:hypothetical protein